MRTRAYSICRRCAAVYPEGRRCPVCDGDQEAARQVAEATVHAVEAAPMPPPRQGLRTTIVVSMLVTLSLIATLGMVAMAIV